MTDAKTRDLIAKLSRLTEARGATPAEAHAAREKLTKLKATLRTPEFFDVYVEGWPGQVKCYHTITYRIGKYTICGICRKQVL